MGGSLSEAIPKVRRTPYTHFNVRGNILRPLTGLGSPHKSAAAMNRSLLCVAAAMCLINPVHGSEPAKGPLVFETHIRPILKAKCFECHGEGKKLKGGLDLRLKHLLVKGGKSGPALAPGKPDDSPILAARPQPGNAAGQDEADPARRWPLLERWIKEGAAASRAEPKELPAGFSISPDEAAHWAFQPIRRPEPPQVKATEYRPQRRSTSSCWPGWRRKGSTVVRCRGGQDHADSSGHLRSARAAADSGRGRRFRQGHCCRRL